MKLRKNSRYAPTFSENDSLVYSEESRRAKILFAVVRIVVAFLGIGLAIVSAYLAFHLGGGATYLAVILFLVALWLLWVAILGGRWAVDGIASTMIEAIIGSFF